MKKQIALGIATWLILSSSAFGQTLSESFRPPTWNLYIFISSNMPRIAVMQLARDAALSKATLILRGFDRGNPTMDGAQAYVNEINANCCGKNPPGWVVHPKLFEKFSIKKTPAFVLAKEPSPELSNFVLVTGEMGLANALKFFAQESTNPEIRAVSTDIYMRSFAGNK